MLFRSRSIEVKLTRKSAELGRLKFEFASGEKSGTTNMKATLTIDPVVAAEPGHRWTINRQKFRAFVDNSAEMASIGAGFMDGLASLGMENGAPEPGEATRAVGVDPQAQVRIEEAKRMRAQREAAAPMADAGPMMDPTPKSY